MTTGIGAALAWTWRRLRAERVATVGFVATAAALIGLWVGIPLYADATSARLLDAEVTDTDPDAIGLGYLVSFDRLGTGSRTWAELERVHTELDATAFGSTVRTRRRSAQTLPFDLLRVTDPEAAIDVDDRLNRLSLVSVDELDDVVWSSGRPPADPATDDRIEVAVHADLAERLGLGVGEELALTTNRPAGAPSLAVEVSGIWLPGEDVSPTTRFTRDPETRNGLLVTEAALAGPVARFEPRTIAAAQWLVVLDSSRVTTGNVEALIERSDAINRAVDDALSGTRVVVSPASTLEGFRAEVGRLERGLAVLSIPTLALATVVVALAVGIRRRRRRGPLAILRRRGAPTRPLVVAAVLEAVALAVVAVGLGALVARLVAASMGRTDTFLRWIDTDGLALGWSERATRAALIAGLVVVGLQVVPVVIGLRRPVATDRPSTAGAWWRRQRLDLFALAVVATLTAVVAGRTVAGSDPLDDPVIVLLPSLVAGAAGLAVLRTVPWLLGRVAGLLERTERTSSLLAVRRLARRPEAAAAPLLLLVFTGASAISTASVARTLDARLVDVAHHEIGAAAAIVPTPTRAPTVFGTVTDPGPAPDPAGFERVWGLPEATRLAELDGRFDAITGAGVVSVLGIDPDRFADVAFWRRDYADASLTNLVAALSATPDGVLLDDALAAEHDLGPGDVVELTVRLDEGAGLRAATFDVVVVETIREFPTVVDDDRSSVVVALGDLEQRLGVTVPARLLHEPARDVVDDGQTRADLARLGLTDGRVERADDRILAARLRPDRQGVFGLLTVGFLAAAALVVVGFVLHAVVAVRSQATEFGVLRALGLRRRQLLTLVVADLAVVAAVGLAAAVAVGLATSRWLLPRLLDTDGTVPGVVVETDLAATVGIAAVLAAAVAVVALMAATIVGRRSTSAAIRLGAGDG